MAGSSGQDWASYQATAPSTAGLAFVFVKATEGSTYANPKAAQQVAHGRAAGLVVGHYHYPHMANDPAAEADFFLKAAKPQPGDVLTLDWEGYDDANKNVPFARQIAYKAAFLAHLTTATPTHQHLVYCSVDYLNRDPNGTYGDGLWIATAGKPAGQPGIARSWLFHQYNTTNDVDHDYSPLTPAQLKTWAHAKENDMPSAAEIAAEVVKQWLAHPTDSPTEVGTAKIPLGTVVWNTGRDAGHAAGDAARALALVQQQAAPALTDAQVTAFAAQVAASPVLAAAIAKQVADQFAARMQS